jgi:outer membrane protein assembly factor BamB
VHHDGTGVVAVGLPTGRELWRSERIGARRVVGSVAYSDGRIYVAQTREQQDRFASASTDLVAVLDVTDGATLDSLELRDPDRAGRPVVLDVAIARGELVTLEHDGVLAGRDPADGTVRWRVPVDRRAAAVASSGPGGEELAVLVGLQWQTPRGLPDGLGTDPARVAAVLGGPCRLSPIDP